MAKKKADLKELETRCKLLEGKCDEYVQALRIANRELEDQITKCNIAERRIQASEARFRKIFEYAPFGAAMADLDGNIVLSNHALCSMLGYKEGELENKHFTEVTYSDDRDIDVSLFKKLTSKN